MAGLFYAFLSKNPIIIGVIVILYFVLYFLMKKYKPVVVDWLENYDTESVNTKAA